MVPATMQGFLKKRNDPFVDKYTWSRPAVPAPTVVVDNYDAATLVLSNPSVFMSNYGQHLSNISRTSAEGAARVNDVLVSDVMLRQWKRSVYDTANDLIQRKHFQRVNSKLSFVDVVKDVINIIPVHLIANELVCPHIFSQPAIKI
jgi:linoleate 10R-lipoxygenase